MYITDLSISQIQKISENSVQRPLDEWVENVSSRFKRATGVEMNQAELGVLRSALSYRIKQFEDWENYPGSVFEDITGVYAVKDDIGGEYLIEISNEPAHILLRTTGRPGYSCEQISEHYWLGPFHDLALANATAYFFDARSNEWLGRVNMRWCITDKGDVDIGIDPNIYPAELKFNNVRDDEVLMWALMNILYDKGYYDYKKAQTPYVYKGHSDTTIAGGVKLPYRGLHDL